MAEGPRSITRQADRGWIPWFVLATGLIMTVIGTLYVWRVTFERDKERFDSAVNETEHEISERLATYIAMLRGGAGLFAASMEVTPDEFETYVQQLSLAERYPGIQGIGFSHRIAAERKDELVATLRARGITTTKGVGGPDIPFEIWPRDLRPEYHTIIYLQPQDRRNHAAIGYDMFTEPTRRIAMERARDTGRPAASGRVTLVQEIDQQKQPGFLIYVPVYRGGKAATVEERRRELMGYVYAPFRVGDFLRGTLGNHPERHISLSIYDGAVAQQQSLLHDLSQEHGRDPAGYRPRFTATSMIPVAGHTWTIEYRTRSGFAAVSNNRLVPLVPLAGLVISSVLFLLTRLQARALRERRQAEQERLRLLEREQQARREAERANRLKDEFLATVSHELRTPLTAILGWSQLLRNAPVDPRTLEDGIEAIERNAKAQSHLVEDLLDVSRIISGKLRLHVQRVQLAEVIDAAMETVRPAAEAKRITLEHSHDPAVGAISGDPNRLQQIVWNLLSNAIKFTPEGGRVDVRLDRVETQVRVSVSDTGHGISSEFLPHVFAPFRQADGSITRKHGGLGLGLAIVRHLTELHGGMVRADSDGEGRGATFTASFPVQAVHNTIPETSPAPAAAVPSLGKSGLTSLAGVRVLIVDDEPDARRLLGRVLEECEAEVRVAASAAEAFDAIVQWTPDVLLSDISMPKEDGYSLIRRVRTLSTEMGGKVPAIALTAFARSEDRQRAFLAGFQMHVAKPVEAAELTAAIAELARAAVERRAVPGAVEVHAAGS